MGIRWTELEWFGYGETESAYEILTPKLHLSWHLSWTLDGKEACWDVQLHVGG